MKYHYLTLGLITTLLLAGCSMLPSMPDDTTGTVLTGTTTGQSISTGSDTTGTNPSAVEYEVHIVATGLKVPRSVVWLEQDVGYITQRGGTILKLDHGKTTPYATIPGVWSVEEAGLMGMTLDPDYDDNQYLYISYAQKGHLSIVRYTDTGTGLISPTTILDMLPVAQYHAGGGLAFGPDGKLYASVGDAIERQKAQNTSTYHGKILRINSDGTIPSDNPISGSAIWSLGHRNIQGFDWSSDGEMYASEHGPSGFDGPAGGDEVNHILKGANYGRPVVSHTKHQEGMQDPLIVYTPAIAPASIIYYDGDLLPQRDGMLLISALKGESIIVIDPTTGKQVDQLFHNWYGRIRNLTVGPEGAIYFTSSNSDGRGTPQADGDKLYKIIPKAKS